MKTLFLIIVLTIVGCEQIAPPQIQGCNCGCTNGRECECTQCIGQGPSTDSISLK